MNKPTRYNAKCKCGQKTSELVTPEVYHAAGYFDGYVAGGRRQGPSPTRFVVWNGSTCLICRGCGALRYAGPVQGKYRANIKCNAKCTSSHGHVCECSCGGQNHGASHE